MVKLAEYKRTATFAWSHDRIPRIVTGTVSGTVDADFSNESRLELWSVLGGDGEKPASSLVVDAKFNDLDWSVDNEIIVGALDSGCLEFYSAGADNGNELKSLGSIEGKHAGAVTQARFHSLQSNILATGDSKGGILIWDTNKCLTKAQGGGVVSTYTPMLPAANKSSEEPVQCLAWNKKQAHIFASTNSTSFASIWDLKAKKDVLHLSYTSPLTGLKPQLSVVEWHPDQSTYVATGTGNDTGPVVVVWDLRNANTPLQELTGGHSKGILSLDWCQQDETLLLSSGRDNSVVLWNPIEGAALTKFPPRGNWCFKTKFAPNAPDLFASSSFDAKVEVQTLQNLVNHLDQEVTQTKKRESETDFWNNISQEEQNEKPLVLKQQTPSWYGTPSPAAHWAFGGKLVHIGPDHKSVAVTMPQIQGLEKNTLLGDALKTRDFKPLINVRLVKGIDATNEEDWGVLERLSMDGKQDFLKDAFAFDNEDEEQQVETAATASMDNDDGTAFFANIETKFEPKGTFTLEESTEREIARCLIAGNTKGAVSCALEKDLLPEAFIIAMDSDDQLVKDSVRNAYFAKYGHKSALSRALFSLVRRDVDDMIENLDVSQWKYVVKAVLHFAANDETRKNELLVKLGDKLLAKGERMDALSVYLAANSIDNVAAVWLREFAGLEENLKKSDKTMYEAHYECLTEFIERFTVFSSFFGSSKITNNELISKFLEFVSMTSGTGDFDLALQFLDILPNDNEDVTTEKKRVFIASGKSATAKTARAAPTTTGTGASAHAMGTRQHRYQTPAMPTPGLSMPQGASVQTPAATMASQGYFTGVPPTAVQQIPATTPGTTAPQSRSASPAHTKANPYAPKGAVAPPTMPITPQGINGNPPQAAPLSSFMPAPNPYATSMNQQNFNVGQTNSSFDTSLPPPPTMGAGGLSGQAPHLNRKANDGWNDLPLKVREKKPARAKPVSVAPMVNATTPLLGRTDSGNSFNVGTSVVKPPPVHRVASVASVSSPPPPTAAKRKGSLSNFGPNMGNATIPAAKPASNPYAPQALAAPSAPASSVSPIMSPPNPYTALAAAAQSPLTKPVNPYAPAAQQAPLQGGNMPSAPVPMNPYAVTNGSNVSLGGGVPPPQKAPIGPPPMSSRKKLIQAKSGSTEPGSMPSPEKETAEASGSVATPVAPPASTVVPVSGDGNNVAADSSSAPAPAAVTLPEDQQEIIASLKDELNRVKPLTPKEYAKQLKDCEKRLKILFNHLEHQELLTPPTIDKLRELTELLKAKEYQKAMEVHIYIATNYAQEGGNWLTGVKRLIGFAEATST